MSNPILSNIMATSGKKKRLTLEERKDIRLGKIKNEPPELDIDENLQDLVNKSPDLESKDVLAAEPRKANPENIDTRILSTGILADNIMQTTKGGKRTTLKERIVQRTKEMKGTLPKMKILSEEESQTLEEIKAHLKSNRVHVDGYRDHYFKRLIDKRIRRLNEVNYESYLQYLRNNFGEVNEVKSSLSINVSNFFRDRRVWDFLESDILPKIINNAKIKKRSEILIWSAGCAGGPEPYSLAIILDRLSNKMGNIKAKILATDLKPELIDLAKAGNFNRDHMKELSEKEIGTWFEDRGEFYSIKNRFKMIDFQILDLIDGKYPQKVDLILCRNVLIYIHKDTTFEIHKNFASALANHGYLVIGMGETYPYHQIPEIKPYEIDLRIFQKMKT